MNWNKFGSVILALVLMGVFAGTCVVVQETRAQQAVKKEIEVYLYDKEFLIGHEMYAALRPLITEFEKGQYAERIAQLHDRKEPLDGFIIQCQAMIWERTKTRITSETLPLKIDEKDIVSEMQRRVSPHYPLFQAAGSAQHIRDLLKQNLSADRCREEFQWRKAELEGHLRTIGKNSE